MSKINTGFHPATVLALCVLWCWIGTGASPAYGQDHQGPSSETASLVSLPSEQLISALGRGDSSYDAQICFEMAARFLRAPLPERPLLVSRLSAVLESDPRPASRFGAIVCLMGLADERLDRDSRAVVSEMIQSVLSTERDPSILRVAVRMMPEVDRSESFLDLLSDLLRNRKLLQTHPMLTAEALQSAGRFGPQAIPLLRGFLPTETEAAMIGLAATGSEEGVDVLLRETASRDPHRRYHAVGALGLCADAKGLSKETRELIRHTLEKAVRTDSDKYVRQKAAERLREINRQR